MMGTRGTVLFAKTYTFTSRLGIAKIMTNLEDYRHGRGCSSSTEPSSAFSWWYLLCSWPRTEIVSWRYSVFLHFFLVLLRPFSIIATSPWTHRTLLNVFPSPLKTTQYSMSRAQQDQLIDDEESECCPLCVEEFDLSDRNFRPCPCGYQVWHWP